MALHTHKDEVIITVALNLFSGLKLAVMSQHGPNPIKMDFALECRKLFELFGGLTQQHLMLAQNMYFQDLTNRTGQKLVQTCIIHTH